MDFPQVQVWIWSKVSTEYLCICLATTSRISFGDLIARLTSISLFNPHTQVCRPSDQLHSDKRAIVSLESGNKRSLNTDSAPMSRFKKRRLSLVEGSVTIYHSEPDPSDVRILYSLNTLRLCPVPREILHQFFPLIPDLSISSPLLASLLPTRPRSLQNSIETCGINTCFSGHVVGGSRHSSKCSSITIIYHE